MDITLKRNNPALSEANKGDWTNWIEGVINQISKEKNDIDEGENPNRIFGTDRNDTDEILATFMTIYNTLKENTLVPVTEKISL